MFMNRLTLLLHSDTAKLKIKLGSCEADKRKMAFPLVETQSYPCCSPFFLSPLSLCDCGFQFFHPPIQKPPGKNPSFL